MNELLPNYYSDPAQTGEYPADAELRLNAVSTRSAAILIPSLLQAIDCACGWVLDHHMVSASSLQLRIEAQGRVLMDVYAALVTEGLELSRESHLLLTERCSCAQLGREHRRSIFSLCLQVALPTELPKLFQWWSCGTA